MDYVAYLLIGFGVGYFTTLGVTRGPSTKLDRMKHNIAIRKEWFTMLAEQNKEIAKKQKWQQILGEKKCQKK